MKSAKKLARGFSSPRVSSGCALGPLEASALGGKTFAG